MSSKPDSLKFQYSGFLQNVNISLQGADVEGGYKVTCTAQLKLPILKKNFVTWTLFKDRNLEWLEHSPVCEENAEVRRVVRSSYSPNAVDPIGFFLKIDRKQWASNAVQLVIGSKEVGLQVVQEPKTVIVERAEKNQKLIMNMNASGIETLEVPVPVIGSLKIKRVDA